MFLQADYARGTKDGDVLETQQITPPVGAALRALAGPGTPLAQRHRMYLELLAPDFPFLPHEPAWHPIDPFVPVLENFQLEVLDVLDVVIAKLARFHKPDQDDIAAMVGRHLVEPARFLERFRSAVGRWGLDARADDLPRMVRNFHRVQRDLLCLEEAEIELPSWIAED